MTERATDVAMIHRGDHPHPAHKGFAEAIGADVLGLDRYSWKPNGPTHSIAEEVVNGALLPKYDIYIVEGTRAMYGALSNRLIRGDSTVIYLAGDQALYKLQKETYDHQSTVNSLISRFGIGTMRSVFDRYIDAIIAVSEFSLEYTTKVVSGKPTAVVNPYIQPDLFAQLSEVSPTLSSKTAITVGSYAKYKGQDILVDAWSKVRRKHPTAQLNLVGEDYPPSFENEPGVNVLGYVDELPQALQSASVYVQPSRMDNFPVSVLEALRAGLPTIVTSSTGNKAVVKELSNDLVVEPTEDGLASALTRYFDLPLSVREDLSIVGRSRASRFNARSQKAAFRVAFQQVMSELR